MNKTSLLIPTLFFLACANNSQPGSSATGGTEKPASLQASSVVWTQLVNATASGGTLTKTGGQPAVDDAGGQSASSITSGDGYLEFTVADAKAFRFVGLGRARSGVAAASIDFAFRMQSGRADAYELGVWKADNTTAAGDVLRVSVESGVVKLYKNGTVFYTSATKPQYPLLGRGDVDRQRGDGQQRQAGADGGDAAARGHRRIRLGGERDADRRRHRRHHHLDQRRRRRRTGALWDISGI